MPYLAPINTAALKGDVEKQVESITRQLNEWASVISNEARTDVYNDNSGTPRILIGVLPDNNTGLVISKEGTSVLEVFD